MTQTADRVEEMQQMLLDGKSFRAVGDAYGITHERVRQIINRQDPEFLPRLKAKREKDRKQAAEKREKDRVSALKAKRGPCRICGQQIAPSRPSKYTCSPEHQVIWNKIRFHIDPELRAKHRESQARAILESEAEGVYTDSQVEWARAVLSDNPPPLKPPTFNNDNNQVRAVYEQWRRDFPDRAAEVERSR